VDPDWGTLLSYRTKEELLAKCFGNITRIEAKIVAGAADDALTAELASRKEEAILLRSKGIVPSPGVCVFSQLDFNKSRSLSKEELSAAIIKICPDGDVDTWFAKLDPEGIGQVDEEHWRKNLRHIPELLAALAADVVPDTGRLKSLE